MVGVESDRTADERAVATAQKIIVAVFKILLPGTVTRVEGLGDIADLIFRDRKDKRARKSLLNRLEESTDLLAERLSRFGAIEFPKLEEAERRLAIEGVCAAIASAEVSAATVIKEKLDPDELMLIVRPAAVSYWRNSLLTEQAMDYGEHYLALAIRYVIALVRQLPEFNDELLIETLATVEKVYELLQRGIATVVLPRYRRGVSSEISAFEANYLSDIIQTYRDMELFGLTGLPPEFCRQPIDVAYITLESSIISKSGSKIKRVDAAFESTLAANMVEGERGTRIPNPNRGTRTLLIGPAGSGKTTAAHWLAIRSAEHRFGESLRAWNDCIPFIVPLRHIFRGSRSYFATERDLITASSQREAQLPGDWIKSKLSSHAIVILDGLDELSDLHKSDFRKWLSKLQLDYPMAHIIITSRPDGLDYSWFNKHGFMRLELQPMGPGDIRCCVNAWFDAVVSTDRRSETDYAKKRKRLLADLDQRPAVRELAETPLLCAMLCAFYAHNLSAIAPQTRGELYERVINTLVHTREVERRSEREMLTGLSVKAKLSLLQALARYLTESTQTTIRCVAIDGNAKRSLQSVEWTAKDVLVERLRGMTPIAASVDELLNFVLERSVIFRRISPNEAQFVHRSLQEYLAACDYADDGMVDALVARSDSGDWRQIIVFAAGKLKMPMASILVSRLLDEANKSDVESRTLLLLAAQCYGSAGRLNPDVAERTRRRLAAVLPPRNFEESELVSYAGDEILPWLENSAERSVSAAVCCMRAAALISGPGGITVLTGYAEASGSDRNILIELLHNWQYFDAAEYAQDILSDLPFGNHIVAIESEPMLDSAKFIGNLRKVRVTVSAKLDSFEAWAHLRHLQEIDWPNNSAITSLVGIGHLRQLRRLNLSGASRLRDLGDIHRLESLQELYLADCAELSDIGVIAQLRSLRVLVLDNCASITDFSPIGSLENLRTLSLEGCKVNNLKFCGHLRGLRRLRALTRSGLTDLSELATCVNLRRLDLNLGMRGGVALRLASGTDLESIRLCGVITPDDVSAVAKMSNLRQLDLVGIDWLDHLEYFESLRELRRLSVTNCHDMRFAQGISGAVNLEYIDLSGSDIRTTEFALAMSKLRVVYLCRCRSLVDLSGLIALPDLEYINIAGGAVHADVNVLRAQSMSGKRLVVVQDDYRELNISPIQEA
jgi:Leucine-rich repeat (LRR) protein